MPTLDTLARLRLAVRQWRDSAGRFALRSASLARDSQARAAIAATRSRDEAVRVRLGTAALWRGTGARVRFAPRAYRFSGTRFLVRAPVPVVTTSADTPQALTFQAATPGGDVFANDERTRLVIQNTAGAPVTVTVRGQKPCSFGGLHDAVATVPAASTAEMARFPRYRFNDAAGYAHVSYSTSSGVAVAVRAM